MIITEHVRFLLPKDLELLFAAMAVVQNYVNTYPQKMANASPQHGKFRLRYDMDISEEDWQLFRNAGLVLNTLPENLPLEHVDAIFDLREERITQFQQSTNKHACQICGIVTGVSCPPMPMVRRVRPKLDKFEWRAFLDVADYCDEMRLVNPGMLLRLSSDEWTGIVGYASWGTYLAASMGLAVIEIQPAGRPRNWLSKWTNPFYRMIQTTDEFRMAYVIAAMKSIEEALASASGLVYVEKLCSQQVADTTTV